MVPPATVTTAPATFVEKSSLASTRKSWVPRSPEDVKVAVCWFRGLTTPMREISGLHKNIVLRRFDDPGSILAGIEVDCGIFGAREAREKERCCDQNDDFRLWAHESWYTDTVQSVKRSRNF